LMGRKYSAMRKGTAIHALRGLLIGVIVATAGLAAQGADPPSQVRVLTYNIRHGQGMDGRVDLSRIADVIRRLEPDVVALQEVDRATTRAGGVDQAAELGRLTGLHSVFGKAMDYAGGGYGQAILSRYPLADVQVHALPTESDCEPRCVLVARIDIGEQRELHLANTHLEHAQAMVRLCQANKLSSLLAPIRGPLILAGDLNDEPGSAVMNVLRRHWVDTAGDRADPTWPSDQPREKLDYVLLRPADPWRIVETRVIEEPMASDHRPVLVVLEHTPTDKPQEAPEESATRHAAGRFGAGWNMSQGAVYGPADPRLGSAPLTMEMWVRTAARHQEHVFISHGPQTSGNHWAIGTRRDTGHLFAQFRGCNPSTIETDQTLTDGQWHYVAVIWSPMRIRLFVDDSYVAEAAVTAADLPIQAGPWALGTRVDERRVTDLVLDDVRISARARDIVAAPELPLTEDSATLHLWNFEEDQGEYLARWTPGGETNQPNLPYPHRIAEYEFEGEADWEDGRWQATRKGPFVSHSFLIPGYEMGAKLTALFLDQGWVAIFDTRACAVTAVVREADMRVNPARFGLLAKPTMAGKVVSHVAPRKAWLRRTEDGTWGPWPHEHLDYQRLRLHDNHVLLEYRVGDTAVAEHSAFVPSDSLGFAVRRLRLGPIKEPLVLTLAETGGAPRSLSSGEVLLDGDDSRLWCLTSDSSDNARLDVRGADVVVRIQPADEPTWIQIGLAYGSADACQSALDDALAAARLPFWTASAERGGRRWGEPLETRGTLGTDDGRSPYLLDELRLPFDNPHHALFFVSGLDFFPNGDAAICTAHGDVWLVRGIDAELERITWQRFATGLYQPLGLQIVDGHVVIVGRDQLTRLEDLNGDGEADVYHSLCHDLVTQGQDHAYAMCLEQDSHGNLYFLKSSEGPPHGCSLLRWNVRQERLEVVATGFRHPFGLGISPDDEITVADNEGNWVPSSKIDWIREGGFYGYIEHAEPAPSAAGLERPLCFLPKYIDNSSGGQTWVTSDRWGDYHRGEMLHLSWGRCTLHAVLRQQVGEVRQAATVRFPDLVFRSGSGTARFHPVDGQLYVVGLDGWQTGAVQDGCFHRVRHTGRPVAMPSEFAVYPNGIRLSYSVDLDPERNLDPRRFEVEHWNYLWSSTYGSFHYRPSDPQAIGHDRLTVRHITRLDARTIFLHIDGIQPVDQILLVAQLTTAAGEVRRHELLGTVNALPDPWERAEETDDP
jgi:endonuclease/exonuclease/phosphatase family metal-dependent hydrolase